jgi:nicotinamidase-related amidase
MAELTPPRGLARGERAVLLISECQNRHTDPSFGRGAIAEAAAARGIVERQSRLAAACRRFGVPVFIAMHTPAPGYVGMKANCVLLHNLKKDGTLYEGSPAAELNPNLKVEASDWVFKRRQGISDFSGSEMDQLLRNMDVETVILTGVSTNIGVLGNVFDVVNRGLNAVLAEDCTAGTPQEHHEYMMRTTYPLIATVTNSDAIIAALEARKS